MVVAAVLVNPFHPALEMSRDSAFERATHLREAARRLLEQSDVRIARHPETPFAGPLPQRPGGLARRIGPTRECAARRRPIKSPLIIFALGDVQTGHSRGNSTAAAGSPSVTRRRSSARKYCSRVIVGDYAPLEANFDLEL